jgi:multiple sugar transport system substrate-binding protein
MRRRRFLSGLGLAAAGALAGCGRRTGVDTVVFAHGKHPRYAFLSELVRQFEVEHPGTRVREIVLPAASDEMHQFYVINLAARSRDFDIVDMDVIWVPEFARAGWLADLTPHFSAADLEPLHAGARRADWLDGKLYGLPWFVDAGVLYYRRDLLEKHGLAPPATYPELLGHARRVLAAERAAGLNGFVWQGMQYEGLVCAALEFVRGNGGDVLRDGRVALQEPATLAALDYMDALIRKHGVTPPLVTTLNEEATRHIFQSGRAVFMRNWPYAWRLLNRPDSPVAGRVGLGMVPHFPGHSSVPTLGGWHLGVNARSRNPDAAVAFLRFMTRFQTQKEVIRGVGVLAAQAGVYRDEEVQRALPHLPELLPALERAQPRPVTPYYLMISQILQPELSAVVAGIRPPVEAMRLAAQQIEHLLAAERTGAAR